MYHLMVYPGLFFSSFYFSLLFFCVLRRFLGFVSLRDQIWGFEAICPSTHTVIDLCKHATVNNATQHFLI